jgi:xanthine/CO dehydrogenase XdhC/CoxF family maturation factor
MTHNYRHDRDILCGLIGSPVRYIGCLGPRGRTEQLLADLSAEHGTAPMLAFDQLHGPAGLDIGAETAPEIALAIAAEIQAVLRNRPGGALRHRPGSIHGDQRRPEARLRAADAPELAHVLCESIQA